MLFLVRINNWDYPFTSLIRKRFSFLSSILRLLEAKSMSVIVIVNTMQKIRNMNMISLRSICFLWCLPTFHGVRRYITTILHYACILLFFLFFIWKTLPFLSQFPELFFKFAQILAKFMYVIYASFWLWYFFMHQKTRHMSRLSFRLNIRVYMFYIMK